MGMSLDSHDNYPVGVSDSHPHFNPPDPEPCEECGEEVYPGEDCPECGHQSMTEAERDEAEAEAAADRMVDAYMCGDLEPDWDD